MAGLSAALLALPAIGQMTPLGEVPEEISDRTERARLVDEWMRLETRHGGLQRIGAIFDRECRRVERGTAEWQSCNTRFNRLTQDRLSYNEDVKGFRSRVGDALARARRPTVSNPSLVEGGTLDALNAANRKTHLLLDALEAGAGDWRASLNFLTVHMSKNPGDQAARDALAYLRGMYKGHLAAQDMSNRYYRYGVRRWLEGDYLLASRALAQAARDNPDDLKLYRSWVYMVGQQNGSRQCSDANICAFMTLPRRASFFGPEHERALKALEIKVQRNPHNLEARGLANLLAGMSVYAGLDIHPAPPLSAEANGLTRRASNLVAQERYYDAAKNYAEAYRRTDGDRGVLFLRHYFEGRGDAQREVNSSAPQALKNAMYLELLAESFDWAMGALSEYQTSPAAAAPADALSEVGEGGIAGEAYTALERALKAVNERNPFFGVLPAKAVGELTGGRPN